MRNETALVVGFTGGYGRAMAIELLRRGWAVRALVRDPARAEAVAAAVRTEVSADADPARLQLLQGDVFDLESLRAAAKGCSVVVHGAHPVYTDWEAKMAAMAENVAEVAAEQRATILFPGNVYALQPGLDLDEQAPVAPPTRKGELRLQTEAILAAATSRGARLIVLRAGDFFGLGHGSSWMLQVLGKAARGGRILSPGRDDVPHGWAFLPDMARAHVALAELPATALPAATTLHFRGHVLTGAELFAAARTSLGDPKRGVFSFPWWLLRLVSPLWPMGRELAAMRYLWEQPLTLDDARLRALLPEFRPTPLDRALRTELAALAG